MVSYHVNKYRCVYVCIYVCILHYYFALLIQQASFSLLILSITFFYCLLNSAFTHVPHLPWKLPCPSAAEGATLGEALDSPYFYPVPPRNCPVGCPVGCRQPLHLRGPGVGVLLVLVLNSQQACVRASEAGGRSSLLVCPSSRRALLASLPQRPPLPSPAPSPRHPAHPGLDYLSCLGSGSPEQCPCCVPSTRQTPDSDTGSAPNC